VNKEVVRVLVETVRVIIEAVVVLIKVSKRSKRPPVDIEQFHKIENDLLHFYI
jgi:hypothetical protein